jgi:hypothetical protein
MEPEVIQSDSILLSGFSFTGHGNTDNNLEPPRITVLEAHHWILS